MADREFDMLLSKYHTAIAKAQDLQEQLTTKQKQWDKREEDFKNMEKITRELCESILAQDKNEMKLGVAYSWSKIPFLELVTKTKRVFREQNVMRAQKLKEIMKLAEERANEIESLNAQLSREKLSAGGHSEVTSKDIETMEKNEKESTGTTLQGSKKEPAPKAKPVRKEGTKSNTNIKEESSDGTSKMLSNLVNMAGKQSNQIQVRHSAPMISQTQKDVREKTARKKKIKDQSFRTQFDDIEKKMQPVQWDILEVIGKEGISRVKMIQTEIEKKKKGYSADAVFSAITTMSNINIINKEQVVTPYGKSRVCMLTNFGKEMFHRKYGKEPVPSEAEILIREHDNLTHGYGIRLTTELLREKGTFKKVIDETRRHPIQLEGKSQYIPDIIASYDGGNLYIEYECVNHTQRDIEAKCNRITQVTPVLNFVVANQASLKKMATQIEHWINNKGMTSLKGVVVRITTVKQLKGRDLLQNSGWQYVYHCAKSDHPEINF